MAKARYRLEALLTVRQRVKNRASMLLAKAIKQLQEERKKEERLIAEKEEILEKEEQRRLDMSKDMNNGGYVFDGTLHLNFLRKLKEDEEEKEQEIEEQREVVVESEERVAKSRRQYIDACKELQIMEKHRELWQKKIRAEITSREEKEFDELGNSIHQLRKWRGESSDSEGALGS